MILIGLGANLKSKNGALPIQNLQSAVQKMTQYIIKPVSGSSIWKSAPVPVSDQPWYYNAVCRVETKLTPEELLNTISLIEKDAGRERHKPNESRVLDIDILAYNDEIINLPDLQIPHPRMQSRAFVLHPLKEIAPNWIHPSLNKSLDEMMLALDPSQQIECTDAKITI